MREHNENNDIIFHDINSTYMNRGNWNSNKNEIKKNGSLSTLNIIRILKRKNLIKNHESLILKKNNDIFYTSPPNKKELKILEHQNSQSENNNFNKRNKN